MLVLLLNYDAHSENKIKRNYQEDFILKQGQIAIHNSYICKVSMALELTYRKMQI